MPPQAINLAEEPLNPKPQTLKRVLHSIMSQADSYKDKDPLLMWEFPKIRGYFILSPYNKDPTIYVRVPDFRTSPYHRSFSFLRM